MQIYVWFIWDIIECEWAHTLVITKGRISHNRRKENPLQADMGVLYCWSNPGMRSQQHGHDTKEPVHIPNYEICRYPQIENHFQECTANCTVMRQRSSSKKGKRKPTRSVDFPPWPLLLLPHLLRQGKAWFWVLTTNCSLGVWVPECKACTLMTSHYLNANSVSAWRLCFNRAHQV